MMCWEEWYFASIGRKTSFCASRGFLGACDGTYTQRTKILSVGKKDFLQPWGAILRKSGLLGSLQRNIHKELKSWVLGWKIFFCGQGGCKTSFCATLRNFTSASKSTYTQGHKSVLVVFCKFPILLNSYSAILSTILWSINTPYPSFHPKSLEDYLTGNSLLQACEI
jgi:hypothetical protein